LDNIGLLDNIPNGRLSAGHGIGSWLRVKPVIRGEEDYAGDKLGSIIEQPCSHLFHAKCNPRFGFLPHLLWLSSSFHEQV